jgi:lysophospholipase L1-like esterase
VNKGGDQLYYDPGHFSAEGSQLVSAALARRIEQLLQPR